MPRPLRSTIALLTGLALAVLLVPPAGASTGTVNSGHMGLNTDPLLNTTWDLAPSTGPCPEAPPSVSLTATSSAGGGIHLTLTIDLVYTWNATTYFMTGIQGSATGTIDPTTTSFTVGPFTSTNGNIYAETSPGSCVRGAAVCSAVRINTVTVPLSLHGSFPGGHTVSVPNVTGTAVMSGSGGFQAAGCVSPFSAYNGKVLSFTNVNVTFV